MEKLTSVEGGRGSSCISPKRTKNHDLPSTGIRLSVFSYMNNGKGTLIPREQERTRVVELDTSNGGESRKDKEN
jgi:hypothetical protein